MTGPVRSAMFAAVALLLGAGLFACSRDNSTSDAAPGVDAATSSPDARVDAAAMDLDALAASCAGMSADCVSEFGSLFTKDNGRADGTLVALVGPGDTQCELFNDDHVVLELSMLDQVQRLVVSVDGVAVTKVDAPLIGPAFAEGWHVGMNLDYPTDLGVHSTDFTPVTMDEAGSFICSEMAIGASVSVFAYSDGSYPASAHQIHRNDIYPDGAIVANPTSGSPTYLLFRYLDQEF